LGATSSTLHRLVLERDGERWHLVLRRFTNAAWLADEPDLVAHEAAALRLASRASVPTPDVVAADEQGACCDVPALLMTRLPGTVELRPPDRARWLHGLAEAIAPVHAIEADEFPWRYAPYNDVTRLEPPAWSRVPALWARAIEIVNGPRPAARERFIHRDYHPTNVLWHDGRVSGVIDWTVACRGPAPIDVAWCRRNLASLYGMGAADQFLAAYRSIAGSAYDHHPYWDLIVIIEILPGPPTVYPPWIEFGATGLHDALMAERADKYLIHVMAAL
jgi:aminoglycoside phosphotransferase (APT) family kinase protein